MFEGIRNFLEKAENTEEPKVVDISGLKARSARERLRVQGKLPDEAPDPEKGAKVLEFKKRENGDGKAEENSESEE